MIRAGHGRGPPRTRPQHRRRGASSATTASARSPRTRAAASASSSTSPAPRCAPATSVSRGVDVPTGSSIELRVGEAGSSSRRHRGRLRVLDARHPESATASRSATAVPSSKSPTSRSTRCSPTSSPAPSSGAGPGVHIPSDRLQIPTPTPDDFIALDAFVDAGCRHGGRQLRALGPRHAPRRHRAPSPRGPLLVAKIETRAAVDNLPGIIEASGAVMVARGDLGNECSLEDLPHLQKDIIRQCIAGGRPVITATQMLESMVTSPRSDPRRGVRRGQRRVRRLLGRDALRRDRRRCRPHQRRSHDEPHRSPRRRGDGLRRVGPSSSPRLRMTGEGAEPLLRHRCHDHGRMAGGPVSSASRTCICISGSGFTVRSMARFRPAANILGFSTNEAAVQQLTLSWGTTPMLMQKGGSERGDGGRSDAPRQGRGARSPGRTRRRARRLRQPQRSRPTCCGSSGCPSPPRRHIAPGRRSSGMATCFAVQASTHTSCAHSWRSARWSHSDRPEPGEQQKQQELGDHLAHEASSRGTSRRPPRRARRG